jgi:LysM repeat protein
VLPQTPTEQATGEPEPEEVVVAEPAPEPEAPDADTPQPTPAHAHASGHEIASPVETKALAAAAPDSQPDEGAGGATGAAVPETVETDPATEMAEAEPSNEEESLPDNMDGTDAAAVEEEPARLAAAMPVDAVPLEPPAETDTPEVATDEAEADETPPPEREPEEASAPESEAESAQESPETEPEPELEPATTDEAPEIDEDLSDWSRVTHRVGYGETVLQIAWSYGVTAEQIQRWNELDGPDVQSGRELVVYVPPGTTPPAPLETVAEAPAPSGEEPLDPSRVEYGPATYKMIHTVASGETLSGIANRYGASVQNISLWNGLESSVIKVGQKLTLFIGPDAETADDAPEARTITYDVQPGDTLSKIARDFKTSRQLLMSLNDINDPNTLRVGQTLTIPLP